MRKKRKMEKIKAKFEANFAERVIKGRSRHY